ncbi:MAG TPA: beta-ketoacyl synthase chain length factor, partial [Stellaceae bacterium]|nr:beta-ketoacyl synthase chain length factor [Stellaceae bacterium]
MTAFHVEDWMAISPERAGREAWLAWSRGETGPTSPALAPPLPQLLRRRVSAIGQMAFRASYALAERALAEGGPCRLVFCSRHGEF